MVSREIEIGSALELARAAFASCTPKSREHFEAATAFPGGSTRSVLFYSPYPVTIVRGEGSRIWDADGHEYADFLNEYSAGLFGHSNPRVMSALKEAVEFGLSFGGPNVHEAQLAELLVERFGSIERIRFCNSGTEANIGALMLALRTSSKSGVLVFDGAYHGGFLSFPGKAMPLNISLDTTMVPYNDIPALEDAFRSKGQGLGACIVEPVMAAGGAIPADRRFLEALRRLCTEYGVILIFDEVVSSRLSIGGMQGALDILPDMTTIGKYLGGGLSFGAFGGRANIMDRLDMRKRDAIPHAGTFNNNVLSMVCGLAAARELTAEGIERINRLGSILREKVGGLCNGTSARITGHGSLSCIHFEDNQLHELFHLHMLKEGYYTARRGSIYLSLESSSEQVDGFVEATGNFFGSYRPLLSQ